MWVEISTGFGVQTETVLEKNRVITIGLTTQDWFINSF